MVECFGLLEVELLHSHLLSSSTYDVSLINRSKLCTFYRAFLLSSFIFCTFVHVPIETFNATVSKDNYKNLLSIILFAQTIEVSSRRWPTKIYITFCCDLFEFNAFRWETLIKSFLLCINAS